MILRCRNFLRRILGPRHCVHLVFAIFLLFYLGRYYSLHTKQTRTRFVAEVREPGGQVHRVADQTMAGNEPKAKKHNVIILTHMSSGSTFTGNIFNIHPDVFFLHEPLHGLRRGKYGDELQLLTPTRNEAFREEFSTLFRDVFSCKFEAPDTLKWIIHPWLRKALMFWRVSSPLKTKETVSKVCSLRQFTVAKVMQSRLPWPSGIEELVKVCSSDTGEFDCSIIHLVRDPRAMLSSLMKRAFFLGGWRRNLIISRPISDEGVQLIKGYSRLFCSQVEYNINYARQHPSWFSNRYKLLRYEDINRNPLNFTKAMYDFVGLPLVERIRKFLTEGILPSEIPGGIRSFSFVEDHRSAVDKWRTEQEPSMVSIFEEACLPLMKLTGYLPTHGSENLQHDLSRSLLE